MDTFEKMLQLSNRHTIGVHVHEDDTFTLYCEDGERKFAMSEEGYLEAIAYMESLENKRLSLLFLNLK